MLCLVQYQEEEVVLDSQITIEDGSMLDDSSIKHLYRERRKVRSFCII